MSKEYLEALKIIKIKCHPNSNPNPLVDSALDTIEQALQRLEAIENAKPSEALEDFENLRCNLYNKPYLDKNALVDCATIKQALIQAEKDRKFREIVVKKRINVDKFVMDFINDEKFYGYEYYEEHYFKYGIGFLTKEEFDLLKRYCNEQDN